MSTPEPQSPFFFVNVEGVVRRGARYLLTVRSDAEAHAPGTLSLPGGKVEFSDAQQNTLEHTLKREVLEETGVTVEGPIFLESNWFESDDGVAVMDIVFLCTYAQGNARALDSTELADVVWLTPTEVMTHPKAPPWTKQSIEKAERHIHATR